MHAGRAIPEIRVVGKDIVPRFDGDPVLSTGSMREAELKKAG
jgi:hypothetical protein